MSYREQENRNKRTEENKKEKREMTMGNKHKGIKSIKDIKKKRKIICRKKTKRDENKRPTVSRKFIWNQEK